MKKILAIAGSNNKHSQTHRLLNLWLKCLCERDNAMQYDVLLLRNFNISMCEGCKNCFCEKECTLDQADDMPLLRKHLQESDIIVFSSPVYHQNMSGIMKNFMDRIVFPSRMLDLSGKLGFTLTTTDSSGGKIVSDMLWQLQTSLGIKNIENFIFRDVCDDELMSSDEWAKTALEALTYQAKFQAR